MTVVTISQLQRKLVRAFWMDVHASAFWQDHFWIRVTGTAGPLLFEILGRKSKGWVVRGEGARLSGCACKTTHGTDRRGVAYDSFRPCDQHCKAIERLLGLASIFPRRPLEPPRRKPTKRRGKSGGGYNEKPLFGSHNGITICSGGLPSLGKRK
jgi:hypothetical protein